MERMYVQANTREGRGGAGCSLVTLERAIAARYWRACWRGGDG